MSINFKILLILIQVTRSFEYRFGLFILDKVYSYFEINITSINTPAID